MSASTPAAAATDTDADADHQQREIQIHSPAQDQIEIGAPTMTPEQDPTAVILREEWTEEQVRALIMEDEDFDPIPVEYRAGFGDPSDTVEDTDDATAQEEEQQQEQPQQLEAAPRSPTRTPPAADQQGLPVQGSPWNNPLHRLELVDAANNAAAEQGSPSCAATPPRPAQGVSGPTLHHSPAVVGHATPARMTNTGSPYAYGPMPLPSLPAYNVPSPQAHVPVPVPVPGYGFVPQQGAFTAPIPGFGFGNLIGAGAGAGIGAGHGFIVGSPNTNLHGYFPPHPQPYPPPNLAFLNLSPGRHGVGVGLGLGHNHGHGHRLSQPFVSPVQTPGSGRARHRRGRSMNSILSAAASPRGAAALPQLQPVSFGGFVSPYTAPVITAANMNMSPAAARAGRFNFDNVPRQPRAHMATRSQNIRRPPPQLHNDNKDKSAADKRDKKA
ncbi:hypothetical protein HRR83_000034 [Exophiala dermatitidis]|nr:hypothetical protein HRR73_002568 [Exophiala dermatitidis]KAJ4524443.1 hypothetical protein HRR75_000031 [Exophiala dermatitidis]KAJ4527283.1 hypothetical protein HRR74_000035 [Exophiala dermatitidis]KAJ4549752.1 hypothetical protein HRR78_004561 [Exophiala dermatitidis]KAJ4606820.1 hypothetical protein HRR84_000121 [Exophiala dermatitidis]